MSKLLALSGVVLLCLLIIAVGTDSHANPTTPPEPKVNPSASYTPDANELAARIDATRVVALCGKPKREWRTSSGRGRYESDTDHLWYPRIPAEVMLTAQPNDPKEQFHYWMLYGASPSLTTNEMYSYTELAKKMPCLSKAANAMTRVGKQMGISD